MNPSLQILIMNRVEGGGGGRGGGDGEDYGEHKHTL